jgi:hypothetical protein
MPVDWKYYIKKKKIIPAEFVSKYDISSYDDLISTLNLQDVIPPKEFEVSHLFVEKPALVSTVDQAPSTTKIIKRTKKSTPEVVVDENGFLVAPQAVKKKSTVGKSRRKRSAKTKS